MKVYLHTYGCRANQYDTERVRALVEASGAEVIDDPALADAAVFNSCAVTTEAEVDLRKGVRRAARANPALRTVVMGCAAALDGGALRTLPTVAEVVPGDDAVAVAGALGLPPVDAAIGPAVQSGTRALLRIQDGCDEHCTFCATTLARGANRSRSPETLVTEARALAGAHSEIVLTGVHIGTYGADIGSSLGALVERLMRDVPLVRFRLSSVEATEVDDQLMALFAEPRRLAPHLHAPLQSGADRVLRRMGRHWYTASAYARRIEQLVSGRPVFGLGADVIAGFPGETEEDHQATLELVRALPFTYLHVFPYSPRPGTAATRLPGVPAAVIRRRAQELRSLAGERMTRYAAQRHGGRADIVVVRGDRGEALSGDYLTVSFAGPRVPRGARLDVDLELRDGRLIATCVPGTFPA
jgi:threonylcarbamoyladenosine tRNA methylthiotransferase MtaB